jgi:hypothetical protein
MKVRTFLTTALGAALATVVALAASTASADDGALLRRSVSSASGQTENPEPEAEHAFTAVMNFYVPAQTADGELLGEGGLVYATVDSESDYTTDIAKPLVNFYLYGPVIGFDDFSQSGFPGHGRRDAWAAVSLDDGETWKRTNLSNSGEDSSFVVSTPIPDPGVPQPEFHVTSDTPIVTSALYTESQQGGTLTVEGTDAEKKSTVEIRNAITQSIIGTVTAKNNGSFTFTVKKPTEVPCSVQAGSSDGDQWGPYLEVAGAPDDCVGPASTTMITDYPGDVTNGVHAVAGNRILAAWQSKMCRGGSPTSDLSTDSADNIAAFLTTNGTPVDNATDMYLVDLFGVGGSQKSVDYREQEEFPGEYDGVGEVPYNCLWTARGILREDPESEGTTEVVWFQAERLTSGRRDVNRIEVACTAGAGCAVSWQEDPEGLRPGEGEGAGTGWAGATTNSKTDIWYSFVPWQWFDWIIPVTDNEGTLGSIDDSAPLADQVLLFKPRAAIQFMTPVRLSNNDRCQEAAEEDPEDPADPGYDLDYCTAEALPYGLKNQCVDTIDVPTGPNGELTPTCVVDSNGSGAGDAGDLVNIANTAGSRPRLNLQPRDSDGDGVTDDAWVMVFAEEDKGLGKFGFDSTIAWDSEGTGGEDLTSSDLGVPCGDPDASLTDDCIEADIGKNIMWYTFAMGTPDTYAEKEADFSLVNNVLVQGAQLNQPEVNWRTGTFYPPMSTEDMWDFGDYDYLIFNTEIARRSSHMTQSLAKAATSDYANATGALVAMPLWKQGTLRQGGPADIMARRFALDGLKNNGAQGVTWKNPAGGQKLTEADANPYDVANMACEYYDGEGGVVAGELLFAPGTDDANPYYPHGLCTAPAINLSSRTPFVCTDEGQSGADGICTAENLTCEEGTVYGQLCVPENVDLDSPDNPENIQVFDKLQSFYECPGWDSASVVSSGVTLPQDCGTEDASVNLGSNLDDQSWYNPLEISKAHRGFLDGDFVMMMYAWSPNYKDNKVGRDFYELYSRRSFDGGVTWTTTPDKGTASDGVTPYAGAGTTTCETWRDGATTPENSHVCTTYAAGDPQQSRNMTQITSIKETTLDPRYTPTIATMAELDLVDYGTHFTYVPQTIGSTALQPTDVRDPSRFWIVYENGDNTTVAVGEAEPLDLYYSRGVAFGDHMVVWDEGAETGDVSVCFPNDPHGDDKFTWATGLGFCNEFDDLEGRRDSLSEEASITSSAAGDFLYGTWGQFNVDPDNDNEFIDGDAMFRRVWLLDGYIPTDAWLPGQGQTTVEP